MSSGRCDDQSSGECRMRTQNQLGAALEMVASIASAPSAIAATTVAAAAAIRAASPKAAIAPAAVTATARVPARCPSERLRDVTHCNAEGDEPA